MLSKKFLIIFIMIIFYVAFIAYSDFEKFSDNLSQFHIEYLPPILALSFCVMVVKGIRQQVLLKKIGITMPLKNSILLYFAGLSMIVTPAGSGELIKSYLLKKKFGYNVAKTFPIVFVERFHDLLAVVTIIFFTLLFIQMVEIALVITIVGIFLGVLYAAVRSKKCFTILTKFLIRIPKVNKFVENIEESYDVFSSLTTKKTSLKNWGISLSAWGLDAVVAYLVFIGFDLNLDIIFTTFVIFSSVLLGVITFLPAGIGVTEVSVVSFLTNKGIDMALATTVIVMIRLVTIWFATIIGFITTRIFLTKK